MPFTPVGSGATDNDEPRNTYVNPADMIGHLLLIWPTEYEKDTHTIHPRADGEPSDAVYADVVDLNLPDDTNKPGKVMRRVKWMQWRLIRDTKHAVGAKRDDPMLATMGKDGRAFQLTDMTGNPAAVQFAEGWMRAHPEFQPGQDQPKPREPENPWEQSQNAGAPGNWGQSNQQVSAPPQQSSQESAMDRLRRQSQGGNPMVPSSWDQQLPPPYPQDENPPPF